MTCRTFRLLVRLGDLLPGSAADSIARRLEPHASTCPACSGYRHSYAAVPELLHAAHQQRLTPAAAQETRQPPLHPPADWTPRPFWTGLALGGAALAAWLLVAVQPGQRPTSREGRLGQPGIAAQPSVLGPATVQDRGTASPPTSNSSSTKPTPRGVPQLARQPGVHSRTDPRTDSVGKRKKGRVDEREDGLSGRRVLGDVDYLNGEDTLLAGFWAGGAPSPALQRLLTGKLPPMRDDFVQPRLTLFASGGNTGIAKAVEDYKKEAAVVDVRLFRKVTLAVKGASLEEFCADLEKQIGVRFRASRGVGDEKVTIFVNNRPAREVMREVARLFGFTWGRVGNPGAYQYDLVQSLRAQLAEEEMRNQDLNAALLSLDTQMEALRPMLDLSPAQLRERLKGATGPEKAQLEMLLSGGWGALQVYHCLTPRERAALKIEGRLGFTMSHPDPARRLPPEWKQPLLELGNHRELDPDTGQFVAVAELPGAEPLVALDIDRSEAGVLTLTGSVGILFPGRGGTSIPRVMAVGKSPSVQKPDNAAANQAHRRAPEFRKTVSFKLHPGCPYLKDRTRSDQRELNMTFGNRYFATLGQLPNPHLTSADVWEALHEATGLPIVADFYSRLYPETPFRIADALAYDALCDAADHLGARWRKDGGFILARSTGYFWDKLKEVPRRQLARWAESRMPGTSLPLEQVIEMASCTPQQLDSPRVGEVIRHCWGLEEWMIAGGGDENSSNGWRRRVRALGVLTAAQLRQAQDREGLRLELVSPEQLQQLQAVISGLGDLKSPEGARFRIDYVPSGWYIWTPLVPRSEAQGWVDRLMKEPVVAADTREGAFQAGRKLLPTSRAADVRRSTGLVALTVILPDGRLLTEGRPSVLVQPGGP